MQNLSQKNVWLIGASTGIGSALAHVLSKGVNKVFISARSEDLLNEVSLNAPIKNTYTYPCDITDLNSISVAFDKILKEHEQIDVLIVNSGSYHPGGSSIHIEEYEQQMNVNYLGPVRVLSKVLPYFTNKKHGHIIMVCSLSAFRAMPNSGGYGPSKAALMYFTESLRIDLRKYADLNISLVYPGFVKTRLTEKNDFHMPFIMTTESAANEIMHIVKKGKGDYAFPFFFSFMLKVISVLPGFAHRFIYGKITN